MKKLVLGSWFLVLIFSYQAFSQVSPVMINPSNGQGFIVMNKGAFPEVEGWKIIVWEDIINDGKIEKKEIEKFEFWKTNFIRFPQQYLDIKRPISYTVFGLNSNSQIIVEYGPEYVNPNNFELTEQCGWTCNGNSYAWRIHQFINSSNSLSKLLLTSTYNTWDDVLNRGIPFYEYMSQQSFTNLCLPINAEILRTYYGIYNMTWAQGYQYIQVPNNVMHPYYDANGMPISSGVVYGVQKHTGPWSTDQITETGLLCFGTNFCSSEKEEAISIFNGYSNLQSLGLPILSCYEGPEWNPISPGTTSFDKDCFYDYELEEITPATDLFAILDRLYECIELAMPNQKPKSVTVNGISNKINPIVLITDEIYTTEGIYCGPSFTLEPGLISIVIQFDNGFTFPWLKKVAQTTYNTIEMSDLLDVVVFPVPITENKFNLNLITQAKLNFKYTLYDNSGIVLYKTTFDLPKYHNQNHEIIPKSPIPAGIVVHRFEFEDGSVKTLTSIRTE